MFRLRTFGFVGLEDRDGRAVEAVLTQPKRLALLSFLAAARPQGAHRRDRLFALFWPDLDEARARDALNQALRFLRQALGAETVVSRGAEDVAIDPTHLWCDAVAFQVALDAGRPGEAMELYRGEFLQGFFVEEAAGFEEWMERERAAFRDLAARGARQLSEQLAAEGSLTLAMSWGRKALELAPDDERALRRLLRLHDRAGDRAGAFRAYEAFARRFKEEFGSEPSPETQALVDQLKAGRPVVEERGGSPRPGLASPRPAAGELAGDIGDRYRILRKLGAGGMATVYLAEDLKHDREVALKVLRPEIAEGLARERFIREIRIAGQLQHPNIVPLFDSGEAKGQLFYVMPHVQGETLRDRLVREKTLAIAEVVHLLREVGSALTYAHDRGVVHRDIKPENLLLIDRRCVLSDFGIARAAQVARTPAAEMEATLTQPGTSLGTPAYMAPEQVAGNPAVDHRADLYAVGVVAYEMLTGRTPFVGATPQELLVAHLTQPAVPVRELRADVPPGLGSLVMRCLAKQPAERPGSAELLLQALENPAEAGQRDAEVTLPEFGAALPSPSPSPRRSWLLAGGLLSPLLLGLLLYLVLTRNPGAGGLSAASAAQADTSRYAVLPFLRDRAENAGLPIEQLVQDGFARWQGINLVDRFQLSEAAIGSAGAAGGLSAEAAQRAALRAGAGRYVRGEITPLGDSLRIHAGLYDATQNNRRLAETTVRVASSLVGADSVLAGLADQLLLPGTHGSQTGARAGTRSLPARQAYDRGESAIRGWQLIRADSQFAQAGELDADYTEAFLWLAQVRSWRGLGAEQWRFAAERAAAGRGRLSTRDRQLSDALIQLARDDVPGACAGLLALTKATPHDFTGWYGAGTCLGRDSIVVRDARSPSGWAFRSSYAAALAGYTRAFELLPAIHKSLRNRAFEPVRSLLKTSGMYPRLGVTQAPTRTQFIAFPAWEGDSLAFVPWPASDFMRPAPNLMPASMAMAVQQQRTLFHQIAAAWVANDPRSPEALEALALAQEILADPACLTTLQRARALEPDPQERLRLTVSEIWMRLKLSIPFDPAGIRLARQLADSLLRVQAETTVEHDGLLVGVAVLTGRGFLAAALARQTDPARFWGVPSQISKSASPLLTYAALGGPSDSIDALFEQTQNEINRLLRPPAQSEAYQRWVLRSATLVFPQFVPTWFSHLIGNGDYLVEAQQALLRRDTTAVRRTLREVATARLRSPAEDLALDAVFPESALLLAMGDPQAALAWLEPALAALSRSAPEVSGEPAAVGSLVRASAMRAELAQRLNDPAAARRWGQVVTILWSNADPFLQPVVDRMRRLAKGPG